MQNNPNKYPSEPNPTGNSIIATAIVGVVLFGVDLVTGGNLLNHIASNSTLLPTALAGIAAVPGVTYLSTKIKQNKFREDRNKLVTETMEKSLEKLQSKGKGSEISLDDLHGVKSPKITEPKTPWVIEQFKRNVEDYMFADVSSDLLGKKNESEFNLAGEQKKIIKVLQKDFKDKYKNEDLAIGDVQFMTLEALEGAYLQISEITNISPGTIKKMHENQELLKNDAADNLQKVLERNIQQRN